MKMRVRWWHIAWVCCALFLVAGLGPLVPVCHAQVPQLLSYQGRVAVSGSNFDGSGLFKFTLVNGAGTTTFWSNDGSGAGGTEPAAAVSLPVSKGLYAVLLGDATLTNMTVISTNVFTNSDVRLRVWFSDGAHGFQRLDPDQRIAAVGYSMMAANALSADTVKDNAVTSAKIADGTIVDADVAAGAAIAGTKIAAATTSARGTAELASDGEGAGGLAVQANDSRLTNARAPTGAAGGDLAGTYPNPTIASLAVTTAKLANDAVTSAKIADGTVADADVAPGAAIAGSKIVAASTDARGTVELATDGEAAAGQAVQANDGRLSNPRTPTGAAGGDLTATYPNPAIAAGAVTADKIADGAVTSNELAAGAAVANLLAGGQSPVASGGYVLSASNTAPALLSAGYARIGPVSLGEVWRTYATNGGPGARLWHSAVWSGTELLVWGGAAGPNATVVQNTGARYNPVTDAWTTINTNGAPARRYVHSAVWTGTEMLIWGGIDAAGTAALKTGARYNPLADVWTPITTNGAPSGRAYHSVVWTGTEMIIWGGSGIGVYLGDGARYNPASDTWTNMTTVGAPSSRGFACTVWSGTEMILWSGFMSPPNTFRTDGFRYSPTTDTWTTMTNTDRPTERFYTTPVWTGTEMLVWGGQDPSGFVNTGGRYDPVRDKWTTITTTGAPSQRREVSAVWTGTELVVWGGMASDTSCLNTGGRYNPATDSWVATTTVNAADARKNHPMIWTGNEMLIYGGQAVHSGHPIGRPASYAPARTMYLYQRP